MRKENPIQRLKDTLGSCVDALTEPWLSPPVFSGNVPEDDMPSVTSPSDSSDHRKSELEQDFREYLSNVNWANRISE